MSSRIKKISMLLVAAVLLVISGQIQHSMNGDRERLGLTKVDPLENAPPMLAFTTVALGGFRGLISNALWMRANSLQDEDKFFEMVQLSDWITKLEPHFSQVWIFEAWNMAYNISVKFKDFPDRWRWVQRGVELLRDEGLRYNPDDVAIHQQLAWFFEHKIGANLDDANQYYKAQWAQEMTPLFGADGTNLAALIAPQTALDRTNVAVLRGKYKFDPAFAQRVNSEYGPFDWRVPESQAIYWAAEGLERAKENPTRVNAEDLMTLRRTIYQSMAQSFHHGRLSINPFTQGLEFGPNLDLIPKVNAAWETQMREDPAEQFKMVTGHRNFLADAVYFLYVNDRITDAAKWYRILSDRYPDKSILENDTNSLPRNLTLDEYAFARVQSELGDTSQERTTAVIQGLLRRSYVELALSENDRYAGFRRIAQKAYENFSSKTAGHGGEARVGLPPFNEMDRQAVDFVLDNRHEVLPYAARAAIRTQLGMLAETNAPPPSVISTNLPVSVETNSAAPAAE